MRRALWSPLVLAAVAFVLAAGCSDDKTVSTTAASSSSAPAAVTTTAAPATTAAPTTTVAAAPAVAEAGGYRLVVTAPTANATIGTAADLCYSLTGPVQGPVAFDVTLISAPTNSPTANTRVDAAAGTGSVRLNLGNPDSRYYDMLVQTFVGGQAVDKLAVRFPIRFAAAPPSGCP